MPDARSSRVSPRAMALRGTAAVIQDVLVEPESRHRGAERSPVAAVIAAITRRGVSQIVLSTAAQNEAAQRLVKSLGFRPAMTEMTRDADHSVRRDGHEEDALDADGFPSGSTKGPPSPFFNPDASFS